MISVSDLSSYIYCPRKLYLTKVKKLEIPFEPPTLQGKIFHDALEKAINFEPTIINLITKIDKEFIHDLFIDQYKRFLKETIMTNQHLIDNLKLDIKEIFDTIKPNLDLQAGFRADEVFECANDKQLTGNALLKQLEPKIKTEVFVSSETLQLRGRVDRLEIFHDKVMPVELKTGSMPKEGVWPSHHIQISAYMLLLREKYESVPEGIVHYLEHNSKHIIKINPFLKAKIQRLIQEVHDLLKSEELPQYLENHKCEHCFIQDQCRKGM